MYSPAALLFPWTHVVTTDPPQMPFMNIKLSYYATELCCKQTYYNVYIIFQFQRQCKYLILLNSNSNKNLETSVPN